MLKKINYEVPTIMSHVSTKEKKKHSSTYMVALDRTCFKKGNINIVINKEDRILSIKNLD